MRKCKNCGFEIFNDAALFCKNCGSRLSAEQVVVDEPKEEIVFREDVKEIPPFNKEEKTHLKDNAIDQLNKVSDEIPNDEINGRVLPPPIKSPKTKKRRGFTGFMKRVMWIISVLMGLFAVVMTYLDFKTEEPVLIECAIAGCIFFIITWIVWWVLLQWICRGIDWCFKTGRYHKK